MWVKGIRTFWTQQTTQEKLTTFTKILSYTKPSSIIFYAIISQFSYCAYSTQEESTHFGLMVLTRIGLVITGQFIIENHKQKISNIPKDFLNYTDFLCKLSYTKLSLFTYYPNDNFVLSAWLTQFCVITHPNSFISDLACTSSTNPISRSNINYKKLQKFTNSITFLHTILKYGKAKNDLI